MNEFDIHVGRINTLYDDCWGCLNGEIFPIEAAFRRALARATQVVCDKYDLFELLADFVNRHSEVIYKPDSRIPIQMGEEMIPVDTWLLSFDRFSSNDRVYDWTTDRLLSPKNDQYDTFFAYRWAKIDIMESNEFLGYHFRHSGFRNKLDYCKYLRKLKLKYDSVLVKSIYTPLIEEYEKLGESEQEASEGAADLKTLEIKLPKVPPRRNGDNKTAISLNQAVKLFSYFRETSIILKDTSYLKESNVHKAIQVLTGYNSINMRKKEVGAAISKTELENLKDIMSNIISLINRDIELKKGHKK